MADLLAERCRYVSMTPIDALLAIEIGPRHPSARDESIDDVIAIWTVTATSGA